MVKTAPWTDPRHRRSARSRSTSRYLSRNARPVQAEILGGMVRSVLMSKADGLGVEERVDIILQSFLVGVQND